MDASLNQPSSVQDDGPPGCKLLLVYWSMDASLNQPSSVQDDGPPGCKLLLVGNKVQLVSCFVCTIRKRTG